MTSPNDKEPVIPRRAFLAGMAGSLLLPAAASAFDVPPQPTLIKHDYAHDREKFKTKLLRKGPAPDKFESLAAPANAEKIFYRSGSGSELELTAWLSKYQRSLVPRPGLLFLHGGNAMGIGHWQLMTPYIDAGYVVMMPSMRGENGQPGNFSGFYDEVEDVLSAADRLAHLPGVDSSRLFIAGHSIGGTLTMLATMTSKRFRAAVPMSGNPDAYRFFNRYPQDIRFDEKDPREFQMRTALCYAGSFKCPVRLLHGADENHLNDRSKLLTKRALGAGVKIDAMTLPGGHTSALIGEVRQSLHFFEAVAA